MNSRISSIEWMFWKLWRFEKKMQWECVTSAWFTYARRVVVPLCMDFTRAKFSPLLSEYIKKEGRESRWFSDSQRVLHFSHYYYSSTTTLCAAFHSQRSSKIITITNRRHFSSTHPTLFRSQIFRIFTIFRIFYSRIPI